MTHKMRPLIVLIFGGVIFESSDAQLGTTSCDHCIPVDVTRPRPSVDKKYRIRFKKMIRNKLRVVLMLLILMVLYLELFSGNLQDSSLMIDLNEYGLEKLQFLDNQYSSMHIKDNGYINFDNSENQDLTGVFYTKTKKIIPSFWCESCCE